MRGAHHLRQPRIVADLDGANRDCRFEARGDGQRVDALSLSLVAGGEEDGRSEPLVPPLPEHRVEDAVPIRALL